MYTIKTDYDGSEIIYEDGRQRQPSDLVQALEWASEREEELQKEIERLKSLLQEISHTIKMI